jgi:hypothetical protein
MRSEVVSEAFSLAILAPALALTIPEANQDVAGAEDAKERDSQFDDSL